MKKVVIDGVEYIETNETAIDKLYNFSMDEDNLYPLRCLSEVRIMDSESGEDVPIIASRKRDIFLIGKILPNDKGFHFPQIIKKNLIYFFVKRGKRN